MYFLMFLLLLY